FVPKRIRRRGSKKTSDLRTTVTTATGQDDLENPIHQALQPRPIVDALLEVKYVIVEREPRDNIWIYHCKCVEGTSFNCSKFCLWELHPY
ncbi:unnamed protein product, partial [Pocillopora meandrina]